MTISSDKTNVMVLASFTCNGQVVGKVPLFKYPNLHFHESGLVSHLMTPLSAEMATVLGYCARTAFSAWL